MREQAFVAPSHRAAPWPLAVDLDGTLSRDDVFVRSIVRFVMQKPFRALALIGWLFRGRAYAKARLAAACPVEPNRLPYDQRFLAWLQNERRNGRPLALATAANEAVANAVAAHLKIFDHVVASDETTNLKGAAKAARLKTLYPAGFAYAGDSAADGPVWRAAKAAIVVNASARVTATAMKRAPVERLFAAEETRLAAAWRAMRPHQWSKNLLVFVPLLLGESTFNAAAWAATLTMALALSLTASSVYLINDLADSEADAAHPRKRRRPIASGALPFGAAAMLAPALLVAGVALAASVHCAWVAALYFAISFGYTFWIKKIALADVFVLAGLYVLRVIAGGAASGHIASDWLIAFCGFFFLGLALVKRVIELRVNAPEYARPQRRDYAVMDAPTLETMGLGAGFAACVVLSLYIHSEVVMSRFAAPLYLWALPICVAYWTCRTWLLAKRGQVDDDPVVFAFRDPASYGIAGVVGLAFLAALFAPPLAAFQ